MSACCIRGHQLSLALLVSHLLLFSNQFGLVKLFQSRKPTQMWGVLTVQLSSNFVSGFKRNILYTPQKIFICSHQKNGKKNNLLPQLCRVLLLFLPKIRLELIIFVLFNFSLDSSMMCCNHLNYKLLIFLLFSSLWLDFIKLFSMRSFFMGNTMVIKFRILSSNQQPWILTFKAWW